MSFGFAVANPRNLRDAVSLIRVLTSLGIGEIRHAISCGRRVVVCRYRDDLMTLEIEEWVRKVKGIYGKLKQQFTQVDIHYSAGDSGVWENLTEVQFENVLESVASSWRQEYD